MPDRRLWMPRCRTCGPLGKPTGLDEAVAITRLSRTALADIRKQINDFLKEVKNHEHE